MSDIVGRLRDLLTAAMLPERRKTVEDAIAEIERLKAALRPFAEAAEHAERGEKDSTTLFSSSARHQITLGHLRRACAALKDEK